MSKYKIVGPKLSLVTNTSSAVRGYIRGKRIGLTLALKTEIDYCFHSTSYVYKGDINKLKQQDITKEALGYFMLEKDGFFSLSKAQRKALARLVETKVEDMDIFIRKDDVVLRYLGSNIHYETPNGVLTRFSISQLTRRFYNTYLAKYIKS